MEDKLKLISPLKDLTLKMKLLPPNPIKLPEKEKKELKNQELEIEDLEETENNPETPKEKNPPENQEQKENLELKFLEKNQPPYLLEI